MRLLRCFVGWGVKYAVLDRVAEIGRDDHGDAAFLVGDQRLSLGSRQRCAVPFGLDREALGCPESFNDLGPNRARVFVDNQDFDGVVAVAAEEVAQRQRHDEDEYRRHQEQVGQTAKVLQQNFEVFPGGRENLLKHVSPPGNWREGLLQTNFAAACRSGAGTLFRGSVPGFRAR